MPDAGSWGPEQARRQCVRDLATVAPDANPSWHDAEARLIIGRWTESHRHYHSLRHVAETLSALVQVSADLSRPAASLLRVGHLATWYHDLAYDPRAAPGSNEQRSATWAREHLHRLGAAAADIQAVEALILMTTDHDTTTGGGVAGAEHLDPQLMDAFHDADLWILSSPPERYGEYVDQVRQEYSHVPTDLFARSRAHILRGFADRQQIYRTAHAQVHWTAAARANLAVEIERLQA